jgi:parallel beta-helix repeat protein
MKTKKERTQFVVAALTLAGLTVFSLLAVGGNLEPSAPPAPTMKTLDEVEPRIPIPGSDTPTSTFTISQSGSYYLTGDRNCSSNGIRVDANDVTINLMGYSLIGPGSGSYSGVDMYGRSNVEIRDGTIRGFFCGIDENYVYGRNHRVINIRAVSNSSHGIVLYSTNNLIKDCTVSGNGSKASAVYGINSGPGSTITGNTVYENGFLATGNVNSIIASRGSTVTGNTVYDNGTQAMGTGTYVRGIYVSIGCTVIGNTVYRNGLDAHGSTVRGIHLDGNSLVDQNTAFDNFGENMNDPGTGVVTAANYAP